MDVFIIGAPYSPYSSYMPEGIKPVVLVKEEKSP